MDRRIRSHDGAALPRLRRSGPWSIRQHVDDLIDTLDDAGLDSVDVVGHSYGGAVALTLLTTAAGNAGLGRDDVVAGLGSLLGEALRVVRIDAGHMLY